MSTAGKAHAMAVTFLDRGRPTDALRVLFASLATEPDNAGTLQLIAQSRLAIETSHEGNAKDAVDAALRSLALDPNNAATWRVAWIRHKSGVYFAPFIRAIPRIDKPLVVLASVLAVVVFALIVSGFTTFATTRHIYEFAQAVLGLLAVALLVIANFRRRYP